MEKYLISAESNEEEKQLLGDTRKRYYCKCPICSHEFWACKSIFQEGFGMPDMGSGRCQKCKTYHNLTVDEENERMIVTPWEDHMKKKARVNNEKS